jgi:hypothetical protein
MDPARDGVTNDADKLNKLLAIRPMGGVSPSVPHWPSGPSIQIPKGVYYMDAGPWGFQLKATTHIRGEGHAPDNSFQTSVFLFPPDVVGIMVNYYDTINNSVEDVPWTGGAIGTTIERLALKTTTPGVGSNPAAHGIWAKISVHLKDGVVYGFYGHGVCITGGGSGGATTAQWVSGTNYAFNAFVKNSDLVVYLCTVDPGGATLSTIEPTHDWGEVIGADGYGWTPFFHGGPSGCSFNNITCFTNHNCGIFIQGHDASIMAGFRIDVYANGRWGIYDDSFLGNTWVGAHSEGNGLATRGGNPGTESSCVRIDNGDATWDYYFAVHTATLQELVDTVPGTDDSVWLKFRDNLPGTGDVQHIPWLPGQPVGTYFIGGSYWSANTAQRNLWLGCYAELSEGFGALGSVSMAVGGIARWQGGAAYEASNSIMQTRAGYGVTDEFDNRAIFAGDPNSTASLFRVLTYRSALESTSLSWNWQYASTTGDYSLEYGGASARPYNVTSVNTLNKMGTSRTQPYLLHAPVLAVGGSTTTRRQSSAQVKPTTGEYAAGDVVWNAANLTASHAGWLCTTAGVLSASAWFTGTNYAVNAYILATNTKYYRCSIDPGGVILSTNEPTHASGAVVEADGYEWTFVSDVAGVLTPFGTTVSQQTLATDAAFTLTPASSPRFTRHTGTLTAHRAVTLTTTGAVAGTEFRITRTGGGAFNLNVGPGPLKALATNTWGSFVFDGTVYNLSAYGAL